LFEGNRQVGSPFLTEKEVWEAALIEGLVTDVPVADEEGGQIIRWLSCQMHPRRLTARLEHIQAGHAAKTHKLILIFFRRRAVGDVFT